MTIVRMVSDPVLSRSYYPEEPRKSRPRVFMENVAWLMRHWEVNSNYFAYGLDRLHGPGLSDYLPYREFRRMRDSRNRYVAGQLNYACILEDKFVFGQLAQSFGYPTPRNLAVLTPHTVQWAVPDVTEPVPLETLLQRELDVYCKPVAGMKSIGVFHLRVTAGAVAIDGRPSDIVTLSAMISGKYLMQERIEQHAAVAALYPHSLNTVRLVTARVNERVHVFAAAFRFGAHGSRVDNFAAGGLGVLLDHQSGRLRGYGFHRPGKGTRAARHPDTGVEFDGYPIPFVSEACEMACGFHARLPVFHTIGWDLAIMREGPIVIEGNDNWNCRLNVVLDPDFRRRFLALF